MVLRISGSACFKIRLTTLAGISSTSAAASSTYISSKTAFSSLSEKPWISSCCASGSISTKVSAAISFGSRRNIRGICFSSRSANKAAISLGFMVTRISRAVAYFLSSSICCRALCKRSNRSAMFLPPLIVVLLRSGSKDRPEKLRKTTRAHRQCNFDRVYYRQRPWCFLLFSQI